MFAGLYLSYHRVGDRMRNADGLRERMTVVQASVGRSPVLGHTSLDWSFCLRQQEERMENAELSSNTILFLASFSLFSVRNVFFSYCMLSEPFLEM
jgi:hypothetical protein